ncbi:MAG: hypothetical protein BWX88_03994 [Planctomycetes bacterium ADurb.Bin126]|nr:MAG: hypothetical protein BWX88_03994 [Planctomycetes bacterium ADurb.Bin126]HQL73964.1 SGNH/GDSL hydrolase family protein [Phycisphaerae bacterium]
MRNRTRAVAASVAAILLAGMCRGLPAAPPAEADKRLQADGKGWRLSKADVKDPSRPRVLLMGDSILNGYLKEVTAELDGKAYVDAWVNPYCQGSYRLHEMIAEVLAAHGPYDVIHFNMGLHGWQKGRIKEGQFTPLTRKLVETFRQNAPKARLIWASSTPVTVKNKPTELSQDINPVIIEHNRLAGEVMKEMDVPVNDLYALLAGRLELARGDQFHWKGPAYSILAKTIAASVIERLPARHATTRPSKP